MRNWSCWAPQGDRAWPTEGPMGIPGATAPEPVIIDDPVPDSREITPEMRVRMVEWWRGVTDPGGAT